MQWKEGWVSSDMNEMRSEYRVTVGQTAMSSHNPAVTLPPLISQTNTGRVYKRCTRHQVSMP